jgi:RNase P/RNase MRP subunit p30
MHDIVFPKGNELEFFAMAKTLGIKDLVFVYASKQDADRAPAVPKGLRIRNAVLAEPKKARALREQGVFTIVRSSDADRQVLEQGAADVLFDLERSQPKDYMHQRGAGLNHILCALAAKNNVAIAFNFASILAATGAERAVILGRMMQNIVLCKKYKVRMVVASFADDPWKMRSSHDLQAFFAEIGMHMSDAQKALSGLIR